MLDHRSFGWRGLLVAVLAGCVETNEGGGGTAFTLPLPIPPVLAPSRTDATTDYYDLEIRSGTTQMRAEGAATSIVGFDGVFPGPTIVATRGRQVQVTQKNGTRIDTTIHNHGQKVAASSDGHPVDLIAPGAAKVYTYPNDQRAGTFWIHAQTIDLTGPHIYRGLAAFYIIRDPAEDDLGLPSGEYDIPLMIQDKAFDADNSLRYDLHTSRQGFLGDVAVVNGAQTPNLDVADRKYRLRLLNASNAREYDLVFQPSGSATRRSFQVIGSDGGLLVAPVTVTSLRIAPAERYDIVVDFAELAIGTQVILKSSDDHTAPIIGDIMQFTVDRTEEDASAVPVTLSSITRFTRSQADSTVDIVFDSDGNDWTLNGLTFDPGRIDVRSRLDTVYIWRLMNLSSEMHPFHKHLAQFNVLSVVSEHGGVSPPSPIEDGWKDTVRVDAGGEVEIIFRNDTFTGTYVLDCHRLEHQDHRMLLQEASIP